MCHDAPAPSRSPHPVPLARPSPRHDRRRRRPARRPAPAARLPQGHGRREPPAHRPPAGRRRGDRRRAHRPRRARRSRSCRGTSAGCARPGVVVTRRQGRETRLPPARGSLRRVRRPRARHPRRREADRPTMTISNESRGRIKKVFEPIALGMGRLGLTPERADPHRLRDHRRRRDPASAPRRGSSAASSSSSAASSTCSTARSPGRPARSAGSARSWTRSSTAGARRSSTSASHRRRCRRERRRRSPVLAAAADGRGVHGQLHPREVRGPRLPAGTGMAASASCRARSASSS